MVRKRDIVRALAENLGRSQLEIKTVVEKIFAVIINTLVDEGRVELRNFGVFEVRWRKARKARNPRTGKKVMVPERVTVIFRPGRTIDLIEKKCQAAVVAHAD